MMVLFLALLFIGPKKLPELASGLGKMIREFRKTTAGIRNEIQIEDAVRKPFEELREAITLPAEELRRRDEWKAEWEAREAQEKKDREQQEREAAANPPAVEASGSVDSSEPAAGHGSSNPDETMADSATYSGSISGLAPAIPPVVPTAPRVDNDRTMATELPPSMMPPPPAAAPDSGPVAAPPAPIVPPPNLSFAPPLGRVPLSREKTSPGIGGIRGASSPNPLASATPPRPTGTPPPPPPAASRLPAPRVPGRTVPSPDKKI